MHLIMAVLGDCVKSQWLPGRTGRNVLRTTRKANKTSDFVGRVR